MIELDFSKINTKKLSRLKKLEARVLSEVSACKRNPVLDCRVLVQKLLQIKPELKSWLEINFKEYL